jgi:hypothetical protein
MQQRRPIVGGVECGGKVSESHQNVKTGLLKGVPRLGRHNQLPIICPHRNIGPSRPTHAD